MTTPRKSTEEQESLYETDASQPEVLHDDKQTDRFRPKPSQAEGDRETVEEDLDQKFDSDDE